MEIPFGHFKEVLVGKILSLLGAATVSKAFPLYRGTRQGCPLSPLIFALALEPQAATVRSSPNIVGFRCGESGDKLSLYEDDTLIYLGDTAGSLEAVMKLIERFGQYSGFAINWHRLSLLLLDPLESALPESASQVEVVHAFKYLGIVITGDARDYKILNLKPILQKFMPKCASWCKLPLSVTGRANLIKMVWAPQLL